MRQTQPVKVGSTLSLESQCQHMIGRRQVVQPTFLDPRQQRQKHGSAPNQSQWRDTSGHQRNVPLQQSNTETVHELRRIREEIGQQRRQLITAFPKLQRDLLADMREWFARKDCIIYAIGSLVSRGTSNPRENPSNKRSRSKDKTMFVPILDEVKEADDSCS